MFKLLVYSTYNIDPGWDSIPAMHTLTGQNVHLLTFLDSKRKPGESRENPDGHMENPGREPWLNSIQFHLTIVTKMIYRNQDA